MSALLVVLNSGTDSSGGCGVKSSERTSQSSGSCMRRDNKNKMIIEVKEIVGEILRINKKLDVTLDKIVKLEADKNERERDMKAKLRGFNLSYDDYHHILDVLTNPYEMEFFLCSTSVVIHLWFEDKIPGYRQRQQ